MQNISIGRAALRLKRSYNQVRTLVMKGDIKGQQLADGHWTVDADDVERYSREMARRVVPKQAA